MHTKNTHKHKTSSMASTFLHVPLPLSLLMFISLSLLTMARCGTVVEDLANLKPPPDFNTTIMNNCLRNPSHRYCNSSASDLNLIFKSTIVASHLCNESKNPNCVESFPKIDLRNHPKIAPLYLSYDFFWKYCPSSVVSIDLSNNSLKGIFPTDVLHCTQVQSLDISLNGLTGELPVELFTTLTNLTFLNLSYNYFSESDISDSEILKRFNESSFLHSGVLTSHKNQTVKALLLLVGFPVCVMVVVSLLAWLCLQKPDYLPTFLQRKHKFTSSMLKSATNRFARNNLVMKSDRVVIYRGRLRNDTQVRIEIYWGSYSSENCLKFVEECKVLVQLCHKNLVQVLGWCNDREMRAIITKWIEGDSVETWLSTSAPTWKQRLKMLMGVVEGMCYLQEQWPEVGYDLRTSSVLLSEDLEPHISRFNIEKLDNYARKMHRFGVFLLEMVSNRRPEEEFEQGETGFLEFIRMNYPKNSHNVIDARMTLSGNLFDQATHGIGLGLMCTDQSICKQPSFRQIFNMISAAYQSGHVHNNKISYGVGDKGQKHIQLKLNRSS